MEIDEIAAIPTTIIKQFIRKGGSLYYKFFEEDGCFRWAVFGVKPNGNKIPISIPRTGGQKILKSADAVVKFHNTIYPNAKSVRIPVIQD